MGKYFVGDVVITRYGKGVIIDIWEVNDQITVFKTFIADELRVKNVLFGEIEEVTYRGL